MAGGGGGGGSWGNPAPPAVTGDEAQQRSEFYRRVGAAQNGEAGAYDSLTAAVNGSNAGQFGNISQEERNGALGNVNNYLRSQSVGTPRSSGGGGTGGSADDVAFLNDQENSLRGLLGRTDTGLSQGLQRNQDELDRNVGAANKEKEQAYANYQGQRVQTNQDKLGAYNTLNKNAGTGFRSLAQIIGRASGTGSSAFRELLPDVVGKDTSSKRRAASDLYGRNLQNIDKSQGQYDISFADVLDDLMRQKRDNEETLRSGIEGQRQGINQQLAQNAGARAQAQGGGYAQVAAAQSPYQAAIENSRNSVESFFNSFRTPFAAKTAVAAAPELGQYTTDRAEINADNAGAPDPTNPYSQLLRKKLQGLA